MSASHFEMRIRSHVFAIERLERLRWRVRIGGRPFLTFCSEARARNAARREARRLDFVTLEERAREFRPAPRDGGRANDESCQRGLGEPWR